VSKKEAANVRGVSCAAKYIAHLPSLFSILDFSAVIFIFLTSIWSNLMEQPPSNNKRKMEFGKWKMRDIPMPSIFAHQFQT